MAPHPAFFAFTVAAVALTGFAALPCWEIVSMYVCSVVLCSKKEKNRTVIVCVLLLILLFLQY